MVKRTDPRAAQARIPPGVTPYQGEDIVHALNEAPMAPMFIELLAENERILSELWQTSRRMQESLARLGAPTCGGPEDGNEPAPGEGALGRFAAQVCHLNGVLGVLRDVAARLDCVA